MISYAVSRSPAEVYRAVTDVRGWWTGDIEGDAGRVGAEFTYRYADLHRSRQRVVELVPGERVAWRVEDAHLSFVAEPAEWVGTTIRFEIVPRGEGAELRFVHDGLRPDFACFEACSGGWEFFVGSSLRRFIATGEGPAVPPWQAAA